ncbi:MAG: response regulator, partial [Myxococcales bacterium]|nr:response regulator [Myxococcales bacterium]
MNAEAGRGRVLIVEDEALMVRVIERTLSREFRVGQIDVVYDGKAGLERAMAEPYDLILSDIRMPEMDGLTMIAGIRGAVGPNRGTPIVIVTGHHDEGTAAAAELDARIVRKPFARQV